MVEQDRAVDLTLISSGVVSIDLARIAVVPNLGTLSAATA